MMSTLKLDPEVGEAAYEFYCAMASGVDEYREQSMNHYKETFANLKSLPTPERIRRFQQEAEHQLATAGIKEFKF